MINVPKKKRKEKSQKLETDEEIDANVGPDTGIGEKQKITSNAKGKALARGVFARLQMSRMHK